MAKITFIGGPGAEGVEVNEWGGKQFPLNKAVEIDDPHLIEKAKKHPHFKVDGQPAPKTDGKPIERVDNLAERKSHEEHAGREMASKHGDIKADNRAERQSKEQADKAMNKPDFTIPKRPPIDPPRPAEKATGPGGPGPQPGQVPIEPVKKPDLAVQRPQDVLPKPAPQPPMPASPVGIQRPQDALRQPQRPPYDQPKGAFDPVKRENISPWPKPTVLPPAQPGTSKSGETAPKGDVEVKSVTTTVTSIDKGKKP